MRLVVTDMPESPCAWSAPPEILSLSDLDVHVWKASLDVPSARRRELAETLSGDEQAKAARFFFERDRRRFIACRGILRAIIGRYVSAAPERLEFRYHPQGKPVLSIGSGGPALRFNVSHAEGTALYGITLGREIGVDLERIRPDPVCDQIAERFFSPREAAALRALSPAGRLGAFFRCWTRKEAYIKARGGGLSLRLDRFDVSLAPLEPAALLSTLDDPQEVSRWMLQELLAGPDHAAAIAVEGRDWRLQCWQWPES